MKNSDSAEKDLGRGRDSFSPVSSYSHCYSGWLGKLGCKYASVLSFFSVEMKDGRSSELKILRGLTGNLDPLPENYL